MVEFGIDLSLTMQCKLLGISKSGMYYLPASESSENLAIMSILDKTYLESPFLGVLKLQKLLIKLGFNINIKRLRRLMKIVNWQTIYPTPKTTNIDPKSYKYPYLLKGLSIIKINQVWEIDITYIPMKNGFMYLFAVIDVFSRYIVGWGLSNTMITEWCIDIINQAIAQYNKPQIINSDQGSQFTAEIHIENLKKHDVLISMDSKGRAIDNIYIERFWRSLKYEHIYLYVYDNVNDLRRGLEYYFKYYNNQRQHQSLEYITPNEKNKYKIL